MLSGVMLNILKLSSIMLNVIILSVVMLNVIMLNVMAPFFIYQPIVNPCPKFLAILS